MCRTEHRLDINTIKKHRWFSDLDWENLRDEEAPWIPELKNDVDTVNFEKFDEQEAWGAASQSKKKTKKSAEDQLLPDWTWKVELEEKK